MKRKSQLLIVTGPTGSGKTEAGIQLAQYLHGAIISADSRQVYRGMDIGTASPTAAQMQSVEHYLLNIREPTNPLSLAEWQHEALAAIDAVINQGKQPLLVGGTMLYIDSIVFHYLLPHVAPDEELRRELNGLAVEDLYARLVAQDPNASQFIEPHNKRRIIRALEVMRATSKPFSELRRRRPSPYSIVFLGLMPAWDVLTQRLALRSQKMFAEGLLEEVAHLVEVYGEQLPLLSTMNYKQALAVLAGEISVEDAIEEITRVNLRYARRQMSWWRGRDEIRWFDTPEALVAHVVDSQA